MHVHSLDTALTQLLQTNNSSMTIELAVCLIKYFTSISSLSITATLCAGVIIAIAYTF